MKSYKELSEEYTRLNLDIVANEKWLQEYDTQHPVEKEKNGKKHFVLGLRWRVSQLYVWLAGL